MNHEEGLQLIWKHQLLSGSSLETTCGLKVEVIHPGELNFHAGPDFFNARIRLGQMVWAGNVEVHHHASEWKLHGHHQDPAYDNVILHVISHDDMQIKNSRDRPIPSLKIRPSESLFSFVEKLSRNADGIPCQGRADDLGETGMKPCFNILYAERLDQKIKHFSRILTRNGHNREKALFLAMASGFGLPVNSLPFEMMASGIPLNLLYEIKDSLPDVEAILFGHSGLLHSSRDQGVYASSLWNRYADLKKELPGHSLPSHLWKFLRIRPASFPTLRLSQFASLIHSHFPLNDHFLKFNSIRELEQSFQLSASEYWNTHYVFGKSSPYCIKKMGRQSILKLVINVIVPFLASIQKTEAEEYDMAGEMEILPKLMAESNHIIKKWIKFGINPCNAFESQALIQLYKAYCKQKRCFDCQILMLNRSNLHEK